MDRHHLSLHCEETLTETPILVEHNRYQDNLPQFSQAFQDNAILGDTRVLKDMLWLEEFYLANANHYGQLQDEIKLNMRKIVVEWMLDVCMDQRCHVDVFLLAVSIMDRFLSTIRLRKKQFQLLGAASIFLASKMLEPSPIAALTLVSFTADTYSKDELLSMELLILSKLKWDLTAITAFNYLDHLLAIFQRSELGSNNTTIDPDHLYSLRRQTERLITLCATESSFLGQPPSRVASASLASAVQQDFESHPPTSVNINDVLEKLQSCTRIEMDSLRHCIEQIEELILSGNQSTPTKSENNSSLSFSSPSEGYFGSPSSPDRLSNKANQSSSSSEAASSLQPRRLEPKSEDDKVEQRTNDNATPKEVFSVSALCVT